MEEGDWLEQKEDKVDIQLKLVEGMFHGYLSGIVLCAVVFTVYAIRHHIRLRFCGRPVVRICENNGRVGVVSRKDYEKASRDEWLLFRRGRITYDAAAVSRCRGKYLRPNNVFVFTSGPELDTLLYGCFVERGTFHVPFNGNFGNTVTLEQAHQHIHGKPWSGSLVTV